MMLVRVTKRSGLMYWYEVGGVYNVRQSPYSADSWICETGGYGNIDKADAEPLPDWDTYPDWVQWRAVDADGALWVYADKPHVRDCGRWLLRDEYESQEHKYIRTPEQPCPNWRDTLGERPEKGPYVHIFDIYGAKLTCKDYLTPALEVGYAPVDPYSMLEESMATNGEPMKQDTLVFSYGTKKEENEMNCPRSKELTPAEMVVEKKNGIVKALKEYTITAKERTAKLDEIYAAMLQNTDKPLDDAIISALLAEADQV